MLSAASAKLIAEAQKRAGLFAGPPVDMSATQKKLFEMTCKLKENSRVLALAELTNPGDRWCTNMNPRWGSMPVRGVLALIYDVNSVYQLKPGQCSFFTVRSAGFLRLQDAWLDFCGCSGWVV